MKSNELKYIIFLVFVLLSGASCSERDAEESEPETRLEANEIMVTRDQFESSGMETGKIESRSFSRRIRATGTIDVPPQNRAIITAIMGGFVKKVPLLIGNEVKKGELLVTLENPDFIELQQQYLEVGEQLTYLEADFNRQDKLFKENITSEKNYLKAESEYKRARAQYSGLESKLVMIGISPQAVRSGNLSSEVIIRSPVNGTVTKLNVSLGSYVNPSDIIMEVVDPAHKHLELQVYEKDILQLEPEQVIRFSVPEASGEVFEANVALIGQAVDMQTRTVNVHGHLKDEDEKKFTVGMFVEAEIVTDMEQMTAVPENAVLGTAGNQFILIVTSEDNNQIILRRTKVVAMEAQNGFAGLPEFKDSTATILTRGGFSIADQSEN